MKKWLYGIALIAVSCLTVWGAQSTVCAEEYDSAISGIQLDTTAFVTQDQTTALLALDGADDTVQNVTFSVWHDGVTDMRAYGAARLADGRFMAFVSIGDFGKIGYYYEVATVTYCDGRQENLNLRSFYVNNNSVNSITTKNVQENEGTFDIVISGINASSGVKKVDVPVWSAQDQSDVAWYSAVLQYDGSYIVSVNLKNHQFHYGNYHADVYVTSNNGIVTFGGTCDVTVKQPESKISYCVASENDVILVASNVPYGDNIKYVKYGVWNKGLSDLKWYQGTKQNDGRWLGFMSCASYGYGGTFGFDAYAVLNNGQEVLLGGQTFTIVDANVEDIVLTNQDSANGTLDVLLGGVSALGGIRRVQVAAWTASDLSDLHYYDAMRINASTYLLQVDVSNHAFHYGGYGLSVYVTNGYGTVENTKSQCTRLDAPHMQLSASTTNDEADCVLLVQNPIAQKHIQKMEFSVWNQGLSDMHSYTVWGSGKNIYNSVISMTDFNKMGTFYVQAKAYMDNGCVQDLGLTAFRINRVNGLYSIMGTSGTTVQQMVNYYYANAAYPSYYIETNGIALETFCQIYYDECTMEGVRAEVAFCQAMKETGFLRFTGRVPITANNFAGLGAVDSNASAYAVFSNVREGIRAQVQHLKAYASTVALNNPCVDPRFNLVTRGSATYTEWLGIHENPYGKGWATATNYGYSLRNDYMSKLFRY